MTVTSVINLCCYQLNNTITSNMITVIGNCAIINILPSILSHFYLIFFRTHHHLTMVFKYIVTNSTCICARVPNLLFIISLMF